MADTIVVAADPDGRRGEDTVRGVPMLAKPPKRRERPVGTAAVMVASGLLLAACGTSGTATPRPPEGAASIRSATEAPVRTRSCGDVGYAPQTDNGAFGIEATGVSCERARRVAVLSRGFPPEFTAHGFTCRTSGPQGQLPSYPYTCTSASGRITFKAS